MTLRGGRSEVLFTPMSSAGSPGASAATMAEINTADVRIVKEF
jgi:hypothetical protein